MAIEPKKINFDVAIKSTNHTRSYALPPEVYTSDDNAVQFRFNILDVTPEEFVEGAAVSTIEITTRDGSIFQKVGETALEDTTIVYDLKENEGNHAGLAKIQLVLQLGTKKFTSDEYEFKIINNIASVVPVEIYVQNWGTLTSQAEAYITQMAQDIEEFDVALETGVLATNIEAKLLELSTTFAPDLLSLKGQLAEKAEQVDLEKLYRNLGHIPYGKLKMPDGFVAVPFNLIRKNDGKIYHDLDFTQYKNGEEVFISNTGSNTTGDGTRAKPYLDMYYAIEQIALKSGTKYVIKCLSTYVNKGTRNRTIDGKTIAIVPDVPGTKIYISNHAVGLSWVQEGTAWKATRSGVYSVYDFRYKDVYGVPLPLTNKATLAECKAEVGTWYTDNVLVYINSWDGTVPNDVDYAINYTQTTFEPTLLNGAKLYMEDIILIHGASNYGAIISASVTGGVGCEFVANKCVFTGGDLRTTHANSVNALSVVNVKTAMLFDCIAAYGGEDGFNYHYSSVISAERRNVLAVEYGCISYGHGKFVSSYTSNCSTAHEGINTLRVNGLYFETMGPVVNDANGCFAVLIDCNSQDSLAPQQIQRSAFRGDNDGAAVKGKLYLINCNGGGKDTYSCYSGDDMEINLQAFRGLNFPIGFNANIVGN